MRRSRSARGEPALLHLRVVDAGDPGQATIERRLVGLDQPDRDAGIEQGDGDPRAHRARADHGGLVERADGRGRRDAVHLARRALGEEGVSQRPSTPASPSARGMPGARCASPSSKGPPAASIASTARRGAGSGGRCACELRAGRLAERGEVRLVERNVASPGGRRRRDLGRRRELDRRGQRIAVHHAVEQRGARERRAPAPARRSRSSRSPARRRPAAAAAGCRRRRAAARASPRAAPASRPRSRRGSAPPSPARGRRRDRCRRSPRRPAWRTASTRSISCRSVGSAVLAGVPNSRMSAPPEKRSPAPVRTMARTAGVGLGARERGGDAGADGVGEAVDGRVGERDDRDAARSTPIVDLRHAFDPHCRPSPF